MDHYLKPILEHRKLIAAVTAVTAMVAVAASLAIPASYRSTASVLLTPISGNPLTPLESDTDVDMATELLISTSKAVVGRVADDLGAQSIGVDTDELADNVSAASPRDSRVLDLTYRAATPELAQAVANSFATNYLEYREQIAAENRAEAVELLNERIALLKEQLSGIESQLGGMEPGTQPFVSLSVERDSIAGELQAQQEALAALSTLSLSAGEVLSPALLPSAPTSPGLIALLAGGLAGGIVIGVTSAMLLSAVRASRAPRNRRASDRIEHNRRQEDRFRIGGRRATDRPAESAVEKLSRVTAGREQIDDGSADQTDVDEATPEPTEVGAETTEDAIDEAVQEATIEGDDRVSAPAADEATTDDQATDEATTDATDETTTDATDETTTDADATDAATTDDKTTADPTDETTANDQTDQAADAGSDEATEEATAEADEAADIGFATAAAEKSGGTAPVETDPPTGPSPPGATPTAGTTGSVVHRGAPPSPPTPNRSDRRRNDHGLSTPGEDHTVTTEPDIPPPTLDPDVAAHFGADVPPPPRNKAKLKRNSDSPSTHVTVDRRSSGSAGSPRPTVPTSSLEVATDFGRLIGEIGRRLATGPLACLAVGQDNRAQSVAVGFALVDCLNDLATEVLIIDATLDQPELADLLQLPHAPGLCELIVGRVSMEAAIQRLDGFTGLYAMTTGTPTPVARSAFESSQIRNVLQQVKQRFPLTVILGGDLADAAVLSRTDGEVDGLVVATSAPPGEPANAALVEALSTLNTPAWVRISVAGHAGSTSTATTSRTIV